LRSSGRRKSAGAGLGVVVVVIFCSRTPDWVSSATMEDVLSDGLPPKELSIRELETRLLI
jgi:hypothetical protein